MAKGPAPKPPERRVRYGSDPTGRTTLREPAAAAQPQLPGRQSDWPRRTREWWAVWGRSALAARFTETDWDFLLDTALLHAAFVRGEYKHAGELRLRVAKMGATPEDRARLRIDLAPPAADDDSGGGEDRESSGDRYGDLRVVRDDPLDAG